MDREFQEFTLRGGEKDLAQLKFTGKIRRIGGRKSGHWEVLEPLRTAPSNPEGVS